VRGLSVACVFAFAALLPAQTNIRNVDFKNFTYPRTGPLLGHDRLMWLATDVKGKVRLRNGSDGEGFTLASVAYGDVTGEHRDDAIVVLHFDTGGTQQTDYIYIVRATDSGPKVLAYCYTGDRAYSGLYGVSADRGALVVELFDPDKQEGDCCSTGIIRTRYQWKDGRFEAVGASLKKAIPPPEVHPSGD
jgi:hypothetical protein